MPQLPFSILATAIVLMFIFGYFALWLGLKIFRVTSVSIRRMLIYIALSVLASLVINFFVYLPLLLVIRKLYSVLDYPLTVLILAVVTYSMSLVVVYFLLRHILQLSGKELLKIFLYLAVAGVVLSFVIQTIIRFLLEAFY